MKNLIYKILVIVFIAGVFNSCSENLDQLPFDEFATENAFVTAADFENGIRGVYSNLTAGGYFGSSDGGSMLTIGDVASDNVTISASGRNTKNVMHNFRYSPSSGNSLANLYGDAYSLIYRANQVLFYAQDFAGESKQNIVAEAKALRAMAHFDLVKSFGKIPTQASDANGSLGVAYVVTFDPNIEPARETVGEVYDKIITDLRDAALDINGSNAVGRLNKDAVNLLLSRVYLYMGQWQNALDAANAVTTAVASRDDIVGVWEDSSQAGLLFNIPNNVGVLGNNIGVAWSQGGMTSIIPEYVVSFDLYNQFAADDIRKEAYTMEAANNGMGLSFNAIKKLFGRAGQFNGLVDYKIFRAAEAKLNKAEALFNLGQETPARAALDEVRTKRYLTAPSGEVGNALRDAIRQERRLEFAFEYQRFYDLKRWGLGVQRTSAGDLADGSGTPSEVLSLSEGNFKFQMPISQGTLDQNPNAVQNPGY
ncbi:MAG: RagB/SusD family nutrient uptake outer membrane protein [Flavobacteriales bacterium]